MQQLLISFDGHLSTLNSYVWGPWMLALILGTGLLLMLRLRALPLLKIAYGFRQLLSGRAQKGEGEISPFNALMTSLSATIGTGNIVGVATAIGIGGPGALFWMWCSALLGMATKYSEAVLAVHYREKGADGHFLGGPMYYIKNGLGKKWLWLGGAFAFFAMLAGFGIGNMVQANSVADAVVGVLPFDLPKIVVGVVMMILVALVLLGGIKRISTVAGRIVPFMSLLYVAAGLLVLLLNISELPAAFALVFESAFTGRAAGGGFAGATIAMAIQFGVARGVFSNEAGLGSAPIAHAAAATDSPVRQGVVAMLGTFIDTLVICSITGLAVVVTGVWAGEAKGVAMSQAAFAQVIPAGDVFISLALILFAFTTILGWSYYGERAAQFLFGARSVLPFRILWVLAIPVGAAVKLDLVWKLADTLNAFMAVPNLIALTLLSGVVVKLSNEYFSRKS